MRRESLLLHCSQEETARKGMSNTAVLVDLGPTFIKARTKTNKLHSFKLSGLVEIGPLMDCRMNCLANR